MSDPTRDALIEPLLSDAALEADFAEATAAPTHLHAWWLGQSGFYVTVNQTHMLFDPYLSDSLTRKYAQTSKPHVRMTRRVIAPDRLGGVDLLFSSHAHTDHLDAETLNSILGVSEGATLVYPRANEVIVNERVQTPARYRIAMKGGDTVEEKGVQLTAIPAAHDRIETDVQGRHKYLGFIVRCGGFTIYHSGDTVVYEGLADLLRPNEIDLAFLPINGQVGNMNGADAARLAHESGIGLVVPCHYEMFEFNTASPEGLFVPECQRLGQRYRILRAGERLSIAPGLGEVVV